MKRLRLILLATSLVACESVGPANTSLGLRVAAYVSPSQVSLRDTAAILRISVVVTNPTDHDLHIVTGGPPYVFTADPAESRGLTQAFRIASPEDGLNAGPSSDSWGEQIDTIRANRGERVDFTVRMADWLTYPSLRAQGYRIRSYYNGQEGSSAFLTVTP